MTLQLKSKNLKVEISQPGHIYSEQRFDWLGIVVQVCLNGNHTFCAYENNIPTLGTGGIGLCNCVIQVEKSNYDITPVGGKYFSIGVGEITRPDDGPYLFNRRDMEIKPFPTKITQSENEIVFEQESSECNGFKYQLKRTLTVENNTLSICSYLKNTGGKPINTAEYNHNFICIDGNTINADYLLDLPYTPAIDGGENDFDVMKNALSLKKERENDEFFCMVNGIEYSGEHFWQLTHKPSCVSIRETNDFPVNKFGIWGRSHTFCPETYAEINLEPGQDMEWKRRYEFKASEIS